MTRDIVCPVHFSRINKYTLSPLFSKYALPPFLWESIIKTGITAIFLKYVYQNNNNRLMAIFRRTVYVLLQFFVLLTFNQKMGTIVRFWHHFCEKISWHDVELTFIQIKTYFSLTFRGKGGWQFCQKGGATGWSYFLKNSDENVFKIN